MQFQDLLLLYSQNPILRSFLQFPANNSALINNLHGSILSFIACALPDKNHIIVASSEEEALYIYDDIKNILNKSTTLDKNKATSVFFLPCVNKETQTQNNAITNDLIKNETIFHLINSGTNAVIVTYPQAIIEKIPNPKITIQETLFLNKGESISRNDLLQWMYKYKFEKVETVSNPGEFSVRGGIVDIFSTSNTNPYRVDFFGDTIEDIRIFDIQDQLSLQSVETAHVNNNRREGPSDEITILKAISDAKESSEFPILWIKDLNAIEDACINAENPPIVLKEFKDGTQPFNKVFLKPPAKEEFYNKYEYEAETQTSFNNNFELLTKNLQQYIHQDYKVFIAAKHYKSAEKIKQIIQNIDPGIELEILKLGIYKGFVDNINKIVCYTDHQILGRYYQYNKVAKVVSKDSLELKSLSKLKVGDYIVHIDHGIGRFDGIEKIAISTPEGESVRSQEVVRLIFKNNDIVYLNINNLHKIVKYSGKEGATPSLSKLGSVTWENKKKNIKKKVKDIAKDLIQLYSKRKESRGFAFKPDDTQQIAFEASFMFEDTPDQALATRDVKKDMEKPCPMDRLICGDVGFGKTEIAMRAAFKAVNNNKQVAMLVPTTILAIQHYKSFIERFKGFPVAIDYVNRFKNSKQIKETLENLERGRIDILIGTHAIVGKKVKFKDLGLLIIDEEQKFGVTTKEQIKKMKINVDVLTLTATPIPRTLHFSLMGARDLSIIATPPINRRPIDTFAIKFSIDHIAEIMEKELARNGQGFFVHNRVKNIGEVAGVLAAKLPYAKIGVAHGQLEGRDLENRMVKFINGEYDILVCTNIVESGLDISNANTIIINDAHMFGLSDLHQMRGRVGRSNIKAYCYLITPPVDLITSDARKRINALEEFSNIGDGFKIAMKDLDIRGAGNLLGGEQSGFIGDVGFEMYHKILDEAVHELKEDEFKGVFAESTLINKYDCVIETNLDVIIPDSYVSSESDRINFYMQIDKIENEEGIIKMKTILTDRFGDMPDSVERLFDVVRLRWIAEKLEVSRLKLKYDVLKCFFNKKRGVKALDTILLEIQKDMQKYSLKETDRDLILSINKISSLQEARESLKILI